MTDFLSGLEVTLADRFSISPDAEGNDFSVVPLQPTGLKRKVAHRPSQWLNWQMRICVNSSGNFATVARCGLSAGSR